MHGSSNNVILYKENTWSCHNKNYTSGMGIPGCTNKPQLYKEPAHLVRYYNCHTIVDNQL